MKNKIENPIWNGIYSICLPSFQASFILLYGSFKAARCDFLNTSCSYRSEFLKKSKRKSWKTPNRLAPSISTFCVGVLKTTAEFLKEFQPEYHRKSCRKSSWLQLLNYYFRIFYKVVYLALSIKQRSFIHLLKRFIYY